MWADQPPAVHQPPFGTWDCYTQHLAVPLQFSPPPVQPLPEQARKDPKTFCATIRWMVQLQGYGFGGSAVLNAKDATMTCKADGSFDLEEKEPNKARSDVQ